MSDDTDAGQSEYSDLGETLEIKSYQLDSAALGNVQSSVNLFRGDVNLPLTLAALPGRNGLNASAVAVHSSHVQQMVGAANADAPTGILGLGWTLTPDAIVTDITTSASPLGATYYLYSQGAANRLIAAGAETRNGGAVLRFLASDHEFWETPARRTLMLTF